MNRIISFSLYGNNPIYLEGAVRNVILARTIYPGWTCRIYISQEIAESLAVRLETEGAVVIRKTRQAATDGMFWRFLPAGEAGLDAVIVRDADSRVSVREAAAVHEWLDRGCAFHIMRDHPLQNWPVLAGMWGARGGSLPPIEPLIRHWQRKWRLLGMNAFARKGRDQLFLLEELYPRMRNRALVHSSFVAYEGETVRPFPTPRQDAEFVGQIFNEHEQPRVQALAMLQDETLTVGRIEEWSFLARAIKKLKKRLKL